MSRVSHIQFDDGAVTRREGQSSYVVAPADGVVAIVHVASTWMQCSCDTRNTVINCVHKQLIKRSGLVSRYRLSRKGAPLV